MVDVDEFRPAQPFECEICHTAIPWESGICGDCSEEMKDYFENPPESQECSGVDRSEA